VRGAICVTEPFEAMADEEEKPARAGRSSRKPAQNAHQMARRCGIADLRDAKARNFETPGEGASHTYRAESQTQRNAAKISDRKGGIPKRA